MPSRKKLHPRRKQDWKEGVHYTTTYRRDGEVQTTVPLPMPDCDADAPWGYDERGLVIAPFGIGNNGKPRRRMPGGPKGGRSPVQTAIARTLEEKLEDLDCDPIAVLAEIATDPKVEARDRVKAAAELANYVYLQATLTWRSSPQRGSALADPPDM